MKSSAIIFTCLAGLFLLAFTRLQKNTNISFMEVYEDIGTIKQSVLKPDQFNQTQKGIWVLLDGRVLANTTGLYKILEEGQNLNVLSDIGGVKYLPDALGKFIRSNNYLGKGSDPEKLRTVGTIQPNTIQSHQHGFGGNFLNGAGTELWDLYGKKSISGTWRAKGNGASAHNSSELSLTSPEGDTETRPVNISLYTYIKIKN